MSNDISSEVDGITQQQLLVSVYLILNKIESLKSFCICGVIVQDSF